MERANERVGGLNGISYGKLRYDNGKKCELRKMQKKRNNSGMNAMIIIII